MIRIIKEILGKDLYQRIIFGIGLVLWTLVNWSELIKNPNSETSIGISYLTIYLIPSLLLSIQIIRNNRILWGLIFGLFSTFLLISLIMGIKDSIIRSGNHLKAIDWNLEAIIRIVVFFGVLGIIDWIIYQLKPKRLI